MTQPIISIRNLCVDYITDAGDVRACNNVSFDIAPKEIFGLAGESGCGKSTVAFSLMRLHKPPAFITGEKSSSTAKIFCNTVKNVCSPFAGAKCRWSSKVP